MSAPGMHDLKVLRKAIDISRSNTNAFAGAVALAADRDEPQVLCARDIDHGLRAIMIGRDHRRAISHHKIAEEPQLGGKVMCDVRMIIHVVAGEIGEAAGGDAHAVEPILIKSVRGSFEREMRDAVARDFVELAMQRYR